MLKPRQGSRLNPIERWLGSCKGQGLLLVPLIAVACQAPTLPAPVSPAVWDALTGEPRSAVELPIRVQFYGDRIVAENADPELEARLLTFERSSEECAYGVYALHSAKSRMEVPAPLRGEPIAWPNLDHAAAMVRLLTYAGVAPARASALVETHDAHWFGDGLRVLVVVPFDAPKANPSSPESGATVWVYASPAAPRADRQSLAPAGFVP